ncbi:MAG: hypothetical protein ACM3OO_12380 [Planctomycetaceae bacterium]
MGFVVVGLGYLSFLVTWFGGTVVMVELIEGHGDFPGAWLAVAAVLIAWVFLSCGFVGLVLGCIVASVGANIVDPLGTRSFGVLAPPMEYDPLLGPTGRFISTREARARLERERGHQADTASLHARAVPARYDQIRLF